MILRDLASLVTALLPAEAPVSLLTLTRTAAAFVLQLRTTSAVVHCPACSCPSKCVRSRYQRHLADLAWADDAVQLIVTVRKFACLNDDCPRRIFAEPLPALARRYARKTLRLTTTLRSLGLSLGGNAGARAARRQHAFASPSTLLRLAHTAPLLAPPPPTAVGIDEWAWRRGHRYGSIIVDLESHKVVDLLPDRSSDSVAAWFKAHPEVQVVSRDRSELFADGARRGAPQATQVVDRFHLVQNLREALERTLLDQRALLPAAAAQTALVLAATADVVPAQTQYRGRRQCMQTAQERLEVEQQQRLAPRVAAYHAVHELRAKQKPIKQIARIVGVSRQTVYNYLRQSSPPSPKRAQSNSANRILTPYIPHLLRRWREGCRESTVLWRELVELGASVSARTVSRFVTELRRAAEAGLAPEQPVSPFTRAKGPSSRAVSFVLVRPRGKRSETEQTFVEQLRSLDPMVAAADRLAQRFLRLVRERRGVELDAWIAEARVSDVAELARFAESLTADLAAVQAGLSEEWSNGVTEGQVNRLKLLKRQAYGRAGFELLRQQMLYAS